MMEYFTYDLQTGQILSKGTVRSKTGITDSPGLKQGACDPATQYWDNALGVLVERPDMGLTINKTQIIADGHDEAVILNIPQGATVTWPDDYRHTLNDGAVVFTIDLAGTYTLTIEKFPFKDEAIEIEAIHSA